ncbi:MAG: hypothetical protein HY099_02310 [Nitrospirae bacterium]|nr:hypothetical protein [Nitrospirota bacterium]
MRKFIGYKIVDSYGGFVPEELNEYHVIADISSLNRFFRSHEYESQWIIIPVYHDTNIQVEEETPGYKILSKEESEDLIEDNESPDRILIGYQIIRREDNSPPEELAENEVIANIKLLDSFFNQHKAYDNEWIVIPVYEGDIPDPEILNEPLI